MSKKSFLGVQKAFPFLKRTHRSLLAERAHEREVRNSLIRNIITPSFPGASLNPRPWMGTVEFRVWRAPGSPHQNKVASKKNFKFFASRWSALTAQIVTPRRNFLCSGWPLSTGSNIPKQLWRHEAAWLRLSLSEPWLHQDEHLPTPNVYCPNFDTTYSQSGQGH